MLEKFVKDTTEKLTEFLEKRVEGEFISEAEKFTLDSVYEDRYRIIISRLKKPVAKVKGVAGLAEFSVWRDESELLIKDEKSKYPKKNQVADELQIDPDLLTERKVFVRIQGRTFDITENVREISKTIYKKLLERELYTFRHSEVT